MEIDSPATSLNNTHVTLSTTPTPLPSQSSQFVIGDRVSDLRKEITKKETELWDLLPKVGRVSSFYGIEDRVVRVQEALETLQAKLAIAEGQQLSWSKGSSGAMQQKELDTDGSGYKITFDKDGREEMVLDDD